MPPRTITNSDIQRMLQTVSELQETVASQQALINELQTAAEQSFANRNTNNPLNAFKSPPIAVFTGKAGDCNSTRVKGFINNVKRIGRLSNNNDEGKLLMLAECHLQDRASTWITRLEARDQKPSTFDELQAAMLKEFVPSNEKARAQLKLMTFKMRGTIDKHIEEFVDLIEICDTPTREAYAFFFMSVPQYLKGKLSEEFPESDPADISDVYKCARKHEIAEKWASGKQESNKQSSPNTNTEKNEKLRSSRPGNSGKPNTGKDHNAESWGPAQKGEGRLYRDNDRCCKCGKKPWSDPNHPCRKVGKPHDTQSKN